LKLTKLNKSLQIKINSKALVVREICKQYSSEPTKSLKTKFFEQLLGKHCNHSPQNSLTLNKISFSVQKGEYLGVIGLNGAGKSTLLHIIAQTLTPSSGEVIINGHIVALLELGSGFNPDFTGYENINLTAKLYGLSSEKVSKRLDSIVRFSGLKKSYLSKPVRTYSSGMLIRLAFSIIVNVDADIFLIDEAFAVGDIQFQSKCYAFLEEQKKIGKTIIFVTHDMNFVARLCDRAILLHDGRLIEDGEVLNVINKFTKIITGFQDDLPITEEQPKITKEFKEYSYGNGRAEIYEVLITDRNDLEKRVLTSGSKAKLKFKVKVNEFVENPIYAIKIRDPKGQIMYGNNSKYMNIVTDDLNPGEVASVVFTLNLNLGVGKYLISIGLTRFESEELKVIHRKHDCLDFEVVAQDNSFGVSNCFAEFKISTCLW